MRIALVRHPRPQVAAGTCYGRLDVGLHPDADLRTPLAALAPFGDAPVWCSPATRCRIIAEQLPGPLRLDERLREMNFGLWESRAWAEIPRDDLDRWAADPLGFAPPGGESGRDVLARLAALAADLLGAGRTAAIVVTHGGPLRLLPSLLRGEPPDLLASAPAFGSVQVVEPASLA